MPTSVYYRTASNGVTAHSISASQEQGTAGAGLPEPQVWKYFIQALLGLQYIHSKRIIHRDIKSLNLFIDHNDNVKVRTAQHKKHDTFDP